MSGGAYPVATRQHHHRHYYHTANFSLDHQRSHHTPLHLNGETHYIRPLSLFTPPRASLFRTRYISTFTFALEHSQQNTTARWITGEHLRLHRTKSTLLCAGRPTVPFFQFWQIMTGSSRRPLPPVTTAAPGPGDTHKHHKAGEDRAAQQ